MRSELLVTTGCEYGDSEGREFVWPLVRSFDEAVMSCAPKHYFKNLKHLTLIFRVSGAIKDFGGLGGPEGLGQERKKDFLGIDLVIPMDLWKHGTASELSSFFLIQTRKCIDLMLEWCLENDEVMDLELIQKDVESIFCDLSLLIKLHLRQLY